MSKQEENASRTYLIRRIMLLLAGIMILTCLTLSVFLTIENRNLSNQYQSSMEKIEDIEKQIIQLNSDLEMTIDE